jgi:LmbE family N-acetylglucosaminyl deacetylase
MGWLSRAHPDDDLMGVSGIVALHREDPNFRFVVIPRS